MIFELSAVLVCIKKQGTKLVIKQTFSVSNKVCHTVCLEFKLLQLRFL